MQQRMLVGLPVLVVVVPVVLVVFHLVPRAITQVVPGNPVPVPVAVVPAVVVVVVPVAVPLSLLLSPFVLTVVGGVQVWGGAEQSCVAKVAFGSDRERG